MIQYDPKAPTTLDLYQVLQNHKRPMVWTFSGIMLLVIAVTFLGQKTYTSEAKLFVRLGRQSVALDPTATTGQVVMVNESRENEINSIFELIRSRAILNDVVSTLGANTVLEYGADDDSAQKAGMLPSMNLFAPYSLDDAAVKHLTKHMTIAAVKKSNVINISYDAKTPELARDIVASVISHAHDAHVRVNRIQGSQEFFAAQTHQLRDKLAGLEKELLELKNTSGIASLEDQRAHHLKQIADLQSSLLLAESTLSASTAEVQSEQAALSKIPETVTTGETVGMPHSLNSAMREQLFALQVQEKELLSKYKEPHPLALAMRKQVDALQAVVDKEPVQPQVERGVNKIHQEINLALLKAETTKESLQAQATALRDQLTKAQEELSNINVKDVQIARLQREIELESANYKKYSENSEQARIDFELDKQNISNLNVLQPPTYSITPTRPNRFLNLVFGLIGALASSLAVGMFLEQRQSSLLSRLLWPENVGMSLSEAVYSAGNGKRDLGSIDPAQEHSAPGGNGVEKSR